MSSYMQFYSYRFFVDNVEAHTTTHGYDENGENQRLSTSELSKYEPLHVKYEQAEIKMISYEETSRISDTDIAILYGLRKQIQDGNCNSQCPSIVQAAAVAGWYAWRSCEQISTSDAILCFVDEVERICEK